MVETSQKEILQNVAVKQPTGERGSLGSPVIVGASFEDIIDTREGKNPYTLAQLFDAVMDFFQTSDMFCYTDNGEAPQNSHMKIWIDADATNQDNLEAN